MPVQSSRIQRVLMVPATVAMFVAMTLIGDALPLQAGAGLKCSNFTFQDDAQEYMDSDPISAERLDPDGNGVACENLPQKPAENRSMEIADALKVDFTYSRQLPLLSDGSNVEAWMGGVGDVTDVEKRAGRDCIAVGQFNPIAKMFPFPEPVMLYIQNENGGEPTDANILEKTGWIEHALVWSWDGENDPINLNEWIVRNGYSVFAVGTEGWSMRLRRAESAAKKDGLGVWGDCHFPAFGNVVIPTPAPTSSALYESVSGDGSGSGYLHVPYSGVFNVTVRAYTMDSYVETRVVRSGTGEVVPELGVLVFGPDPMIISVYLEEGQYSVSTSAVGSWVVSLTDPNDE
ncbi:MAG: hypothetical protein ACR2OE_17845 [Thermomicrobiales bacterium]